MGDLVTFRRAAKMLGLSHSTVSRYVRDHPELNHGDDRGPLVDPDELERHRASNVNQVMAGNHAGRLFDDDGDADADPYDDEVVEDDVGEAPRRAPAGRGAGYAQARTVREAIAAKKANLEYQRMLGELVYRTEVEEAGMQAGRLLMTALNARNAKLAERLAATSDQREVLTILENEDRDLLEQLNASVRRYLEENFGDESDAA